MNLSRLMILGLLTERGPMHGHQIRRAGELANAEVWGGITGGALYAELRKLSGEALIRAVREEQVGRRPARTVYEITDEGHLELAIQRDAALDVVSARPTPYRSCCCSRLARTSLTCVNGSRLAAVGSRSSSTRWRQNGSG